MSAEDWLKQVNQIIERYRVSCGTAGPAERAVLYEQAFNALRDLRPKVDIADAARWLNATGYRQS